MLARPDRDVDKRPSTILPTTLNPFPPSATSILAIATFRPCCGVLVFVSKGPETSRSYCQIVRSSSPIEYVDKSQWKVYPRQTATSLPVDSHAAGRRNGTDDSFDPPLPLSLSHWNGGFILPEPRQRNISMSEEDPSRKRPIEVTSVGVRCDGRRERKDAANEVDEFRSRRWAKSVHRRDRFRALQTAQQRPSANDVRMVERRLDRKGAYAVEDGEVGSDHQRDLVDWTE